jgi:hypothetical protein
MSILGEDKKMYDQKKPADNFVMNGRGKGFAGEK